MNNIINENTHNLLDMKYLSYPPYSSISSGVRITIIKYKQNIFSRLTIYNGGP